VTCARRFAAHAHVIPAKAGIQIACNADEAKTLGSRFRGNDGTALSHVQHRQNQLRRMAGVVVNRVAADLVGAIDVEEEAIRDG
jgi:hypothetical protein